MAPLFRALLWSGVFDPFEISLAHIGTAHLAHAILSLFGRQARYLLALLLALALRLLQLLAILLGQRLLQLLLQSLTLVAHGFTLLC